MRYGRSQSMQDINIQIAINEEHNKGSKNHCNRALLPADHSWLSSGQRKGAPGIVTKLLFRSYWQQSDLDNRAGHRLYVIKNINHIDFPG